MLDEIRQNYTVFQKEWQDNLSARVSDFPSHAKRFERSYIRLTSLQAWRAGVVEQQLAHGSIGFYIEAQNDALISHVQASLGSWRVALKSLRSCIENILLCLYYKDHPIELVLWESGAFRLSFSEAMQYFKKHPLIKNVQSDLTGLSLISEEYKKLSIAVHSSAVDFRMTEGATNLLLWNTDNKHESIWETHEKKTLQGLNMLMLTIFRQLLQGASLGSVRQALGLVIPSRKDAEIKAKLRVTIKR